MSFTLTPDAQAILLLTGVFGAKEVVEPLSLREYNEVTEWLIREKLSPADLLKPEAIQALEKSLFPIDPPRIALLLGRGAAMAFALAKWERQGIWFLCRSDAAYPRCLKTHLGRHSPAFFYGAGNSNLLVNGGLGAVGSRNVSSDGLRFAQDLGKACAKECMQIVSGGARGADETAMLACLLQGGTSVGILSDSLLRTAISTKYRDAVREGTVCLISPFHPEAGFSVGNAMSRNKFIYALSDATVVVASDFMKGGTWAGVDEELKRQSNAKPVFIFAPPDMPEGNKELLKRKTRRVVHEDLENSVRSFFFTEPHPVASEVKVEVLDSATSGIMASLVRESPDDTAPRLENTQKIFDCVLPSILSALSNPKSSKVLAVELDVLESQMKLWLDRAVSDSVINKKTSKRKTVYQKTDGELFTS